MTNFQIAVLSLIIFIVVLVVVFTYWLPNKIKDITQKQCNKNNEPLKSSGELIDTHLFMLRLAENLSLFDTKVTALMILPMKLVVR